MKIRDVVVAMVIINIVTVLLAVMIVNSMKSGPSQTAKDKQPPVTMTAPVPTVPAVAEKPAVTKEEVFALLDKGRDARRKEAIREFKKVMQDTPPYNVQGRVSNGYQTAVDGDIKKALEITQEEINRDAGRAESHYTLAWIYAKIGEYDKALKICNELAKQGKDFAKLYLIEGWIDARQGKYDDALKACDAALAADPYSAPLLYAKGRIADLAGRTDQAVELYTKSIGIQGDIYEVHIFLGFLYSEMGRNEDAIKAFKQAISLNRYRTGGYVGLGMVYDEMGNYQAALDQYNNAVALGWVNLDATAPKKSMITTVEVDDAVILNRIGTLNIRIGDYPAAVDAFNRAVAAKREFHESYRGLILAYVLQGSKESAVKTYNELKTLNPDMAKSVASFVGQNP